MNFAHINHQEDRRLFSTPAGFGADEPQRLQARVWRNGQFRRFSRRSFQAEMAEIERATSPSASQFEGR